MEFNVGDMFLNPKSGGIAEIINVDLYGGMDIDVNGDIQDDVLYTLKGKSTGVLIKVDGFKLNGFLSAKLLCTFDNPLEPKRYKKLVRFNFV